MIIVIGPTVSQHHANERFINAALGAAYPGMLEKEDRPHHFLIAGWAHFYHECDLSRAKHIFLRTSMDTGKILAD